MRVTIDRFEGDFAVCEKPDRTMLNIERSKIPAGVREGDVLFLNGDNIRTNPKETAKKKKEADDLLEGLWKN